MAAFGQFVCVVLVATATLPACAQQAQSAALGIPASLPPPRDLVRDVMYNELHDKERDSHWEYRSECLSSTQNLVREQVETDDGPVFRIVEMDGSPLNDAQRRREEQRLDSYIHSPEQIARVQRAHDEDEARIARIMSFLPDAFRFSYEGVPEKDIVRISFRPNPGFVPSGYEARIVHALVGTLTVNTRLKRMIDMRGTVSERVDFGYGLLGHVDKGGTFEIHRVQVSAERWKTDLVAVHVEGRILMLKTVNKDQREARSDFRPVPKATTLAEARQMLSEATDQADRADLTPAAGEHK